MGNYTNTDLIVIHLYKNAIFNVYMHAFIYLYVCVCISMCVYVTVGECMCLSVVSFKSVECITAAQS